MQCVNPRYAIMQPITKKDGTKGKKPFFIHDSNGCYVHTLCDEKKKYYEDNFSDAFVKLPCGECVACRLNKARDWANRLMLEAKHSSSCYFLTLTYDNNHIEHLKTDLYDKDTEELVYSDFLNLNKKDLQDFMKRLRRHFEYNYGVTNIRFYACGEYGSTTQRPHFHIILYNCPFNDLEHPSYLDSRPNSYISKTVAKLWPFGFHLVYKTEWNMCAYVSGYVSKKYANKSYCSYDAFVSEFSLMSRRPGIARLYYDSNFSEIYDKDELIVPIKEGATRTARPVKYYDRLFDLDYPETFQEIKNHRKEFAVQNEKMVLEQTGLSPEEYLEMQRRKLETKNKNKRKEL